MSKLSFRARALDATKPLPIYNAVDLPDLSEYTTINRTVPQMPTGMEKEEETERHLQDVILAQQTNNTNKHIVIPTPENAIHVSYYEEITTRIDRPPPQYIRLPGLSLDEDVPDYDLDSEDEEWLNLQTNEKPLSCLHFEQMMDKLEKGSGNTVLSLRGAQALLKDDEDLVLAVYDYWLAKRLRLGGALIPMVKHERRDGTSSGSNPYLAFRKRTEKMQTRKNRKNDETAYMQMQKLKRDLDKAFALTNMVKEREAKKHQIAEIQMDIFKKRYLLEDWSGSIMTALCPVATHSATSRQNSNVSNSSWDGSSVLIKVEGGDDYAQVGRHEVLVSSGLGLQKRKRKKKYYFPSNSVESPLPPMPSTPDKVHLDPSRDVSNKLQEEDLDGLYTFKRKPYVKYYPVRAHCESWPWEDEESHSVGGSDGEMEDGSYTTRARVPKPKRFRFSQLSLSASESLGVCRRRVGRGGRTMFDRISMDFDPDENRDPEGEEDPSMDTDPPASSQAATPTGSTSGHAPFVSPASRTPTSPSHSHAGTSQSHSPIARQQSEIVGSVGGPSGGRVSGLVRSQSVQAVPSSRDRDVVATPPGAAVGGSQKVAVASPIKSLHFVARSPPPDSKQDLPSASLAFIVNQPPPPGPASFLPDATEHAQMPFPYPLGAGAFMGGISRLPSSEGEDAMMSFSSLPTSHFTLRPSSSEADSSDKAPPMHYHWRQPTLGYHVQSDSETWNWNRPAEIHDLEANRRRRRRFRREPANTGGSVGGSLSNSLPALPPSLHPPTPPPGTPPPLPPSSNSHPAPGSYGSNLLLHGTRSHPIKHNNGTSSSTSTAQQQQVAPDHPSNHHAHHSQDKSSSSSAGSESAPSKPDVSRSSLSVTDSKTIVLTNSPASWHPSGSSASASPASAAAAGGGDKKKDAEKVLSQQQNHRLPNNNAAAVAATAKAHVAQAAEQEARKGAQGVAGEAPRGSGSGGGGREVKAEGGVAGGDDGRGLPPESKRSRKLEEAGNVAGNRKTQASNNKCEPAPSSNPVSTSSSTTSVSDQSSSSTSTKGASDATPTPSSQAAPPTSKSADKSSAVEEKKAVSEVKKPLPKPVNVWSLRGPANGILSLNLSSGTRKRKRAESRKAGKGLERRGASVESALAIASQFAAKVMVKKEEGSGGGGGVAPPSEVLAPSSLGGILVRGGGGGGGLISATGSRSGSSTPTILSTAADVLTQQKLASIGGVVTGLAAAAAAAGGVGVGKIPVELAHAPPPPTAPPPVIITQQQQQQENVTTASTPTSQVSEIKPRANSLAGHVILSQQPPHSAVVGGVASAGHHPAGVTVSTGTNGTNLQEIFAKRKLSEAKGQGKGQSKGQGLKQALAGTVMNHNSIMETAAKPLVTPTLKNSSEVT